MSSSPERKGAALPTKKARPQEVSDGTLADVVRARNSDAISNDDFSNQLRCLRLILGKNFRPISTERLASLSGIAPVSIRATEAGRRRLNEDDRLSIELLLGAIWNPKSRQWVAARDHTPYTRQKYESHFIQLLQAPNLKQQRAECHKMVDRYLDALEPAKLPFGLSKVQRSLKMLSPPTSESGSGSPTNKLNRGKEVDQ